MWLIDVPIMTNCGAAAPSEMRGLRIFASAYHTRWR